MSTSYPPIAGADTQSAAAAAQPFAGEAPIVTDSAAALAAIAQYQVCALTAAGITPFVVGTHTKDQAVVASNSAAAAGAGYRVGYYTRGKFNHEALTWPASLDTLLKRKHFVNGTGLDVGHLLPNPVGT